jgi:hypothetical protein
MTFCMEDKVTPVKVGICLVQLRSYFAFFIKHDILAGEFEDRQQLVFVTVLLFSVIFMNQHMLSQIFTHYSISLSVLNSLVLILGCIYRIYGIQNIGKDWKKILLNCVAIIIVYPSYIYID